VLGRQYLGLTDRRRRLNIDDDRVIDVDQIVGRIGEERRSTMRSGPPRCRIAWRNELRRDLACGAERCIVENGEIFLDRTAGRSRWQTRGTLDAIAVAGIGLDQTGIDGKAFAAKKTLLDASLQNGLEQPSE
jgi:hypothetical protein